MGTKAMIADYYTKLLQRELFRGMRDKIMRVIFFYGEPINIYAQIVGVCWDILYVYDLSP